MRRVHHHHVHGPFGLFVALMSLPFYVAYALVAPFVGVGRLLSRRKRRRGSAQQAVNRQSTAQRREDYLQRRVTVETLWAGTSLAERPLSSMTPAQAWKSRRWFRWLMIAGGAALLGAAVALPGLLLVETLLVAVFVTSHRRDAEVERRRRHLLPLIDHAAEAARAEALGLDESAAMWRASGS